MDPYKDATEKSAEEIAALVFEIINQHDDVVSQIQPIAIEEVLKEHEETATLVNIASRLQQYLVQLGYEELRHADTKILMNALIERYSDGEEMPLQHVLERMSGFEAEDSEA